jgi:hypothetical protein
MGSSILLNYLTEFDEMYLMFTLNWWRSLFGSTYVNDRRCDDLTLRWLVRSLIVPARSVVHIQHTHAQTKIQNTLR